MFAFLLFWSKGQEAGLLSTETLQILLGGRDRERTRERARDSFSVVDHGRQLDFLFYQSGYGH